MTKKALLAGLFAAATVTADWNGLNMNWNVQKMTVKNVDAEGNVDIEGADNLEINADALSRLNLESYGKKPAAKKEVPVPEPEQVPETPSAADTTQKPQGEKKKTVEEIEEEESACVTDRPIFGILM